MVQASFSRNACRTKRVNSVSQVFILINSHYKRIIHKNYNCFLHIILNFIKVGKNFLFRASKVKIWGFDVL